MVWNVNGAGQGRGREPGRVVCRLCLEQTLSSSLCACVPVLAPGFCPSPVLQDVLLAVVTLPFPTSSQGEPVAAASYSSRQDQDPAGVLSLFPNLCLWSWTPPCLVLSKASELCTKLQSFLEDFSPQGYSLFTPTMKSSLAIQLWPVWYNMR